MTGASLILTFLLVFVGCVVAFLPSSPKAFRRQSHDVAMTVSPSDTFALLFDCDGVIVETEELHRLAYNKAFESFELKINGKQVVWSESYYDRLANTVGGGKPKMKYHFNTEVQQWPTPKDRDVPTTDAEKDSLVDDLQDAKTEFYKEIVEEVAVARPGVLALLDEAIADPNIKVGICSAATKR